MPSDTIAAIATPSGRGGIGVIRISGPKVPEMATAFLGTLPTPRQAHYTDFVDHHHTVLDQGIALYFKAPHSFTGEDVLELQGHGGPVVLNQLLAQVLTCGARLAEPGEFSKRAFLNDKLDLTQAEAIADLINASSVQAARNALHTLQGAFSDRIHTLVKELIHLRVYIEATLDFPEEEIDFLSDPKISESLKSLLAQLDTLLASAKQGALIQEGIRVVITGRPNAGKSSLLNQLTERDSAIVTDIPGTTRDVLREQIELDGLPLHIIDTAGLRESTDPIEQEGIKRAHLELDRADVILKLIDSTALQKSDWELTMLGVPTLLVFNKIDLLSEAARTELLQQLQLRESLSFVLLSAKTGAGLSDLKDKLKTLVGFNTTLEGQFVARARHLQALERAQRALKEGLAQLQHHRAAELLAEDLLTAQHALNEITGRFTSDDLLGEIFSSFCIGK